MNATQKQGPSTDATPRSVPLLELRGVGRDYRVRNGRRSVVLAAVTNLSFTIRAGQTLGLVGETGCGKSTTARSIIQAPPPSRGTVLLHGIDLSRLRGARLRRARRDIQIIFQDPHSSLDPRWTVNSLVAEPLRLNGAGSRTERDRRVAELLDLVGLDPSQHGHRRPAQLSGGQAQRVGIARALALSPALVICDEPVSSLDVSIQAQVLNLLERLRTELGLTYLFISHDLAVVRHVSDQVGVMYLGRLCEIGPSDTIYRHPAHPYTASLLAAMPSPRLDQAPAPMPAAHGEIPSPLNPPSGCPYRTRCQHARQRCADQTPELTAVGDEHQVACHYPLTTVS